MINTESLHQRLDALMGPKMVAFLDELKAAYATGNPAEIFKLVGRSKTQNAEVVANAQPTVEEQVEAVLASQASAPVEALAASESTPVAALTSMDMALTNANVTPEVKPTLEKTGKRDIKGILSALHQAFSAGKSPFSITSLSAQTA